MAYNSQCHKQAVLEKSLTSYSNSTGSACRWSDVLPAILARALQHCCPVIFTLAKAWLGEQQQAQSQAMAAGAVSKDSHQVAVDLQQSLSEQPTLSTA